MITLQSASRGDAWRGVLAEAAARTVRIQLAWVVRIGKCAARVQGKDLANPTALLLSGVMMLRHLDLVQQADMIQTACLKTIADGKYRTGDLGGNATTTQYTDAVIGNMQG